MGNAHPTNHDWLTLGSGHGERRAEDRIDSKMCNGLTGCDASDKKVCVRDWVVDVSKMSRSSVLMNSIKSCEIKKLKA